MRIRIKNDIEFKWAITREDGKILSPNDFTDEEKQLLASIAERLVEAEKGLAKIPIFEILTN